MNYEQINDDGSHISFAWRRRPQLLAVDNVGSAPARNRCEI